MIALESLSRISVDDYLTFEQASKICHELVDGYLYANAIKLSITGAVRD
ncbi:hypothetical protein [Candidatus Thiosymbion oneisti]|nr:hypothetical protein [Candidatus Thiosymbion oneisti]